MSKAKPFNIVVTDQYDDSEGNEKTSYTTVGVAFHNKKSNTFSCRIAKGLSVSGEFVLFEKQDKKD